MKIFKKALFLILSPRMYSIPCIGIILLYFSKLLLKYERNQRLITEENYKKGIKNYNGYINECLNYSLISAVLFLIFLLILCSAPE